VDLSDPNQPRGHHTQYYGDGFRLSWDTDGTPHVINEHWTDQNAPRGDPARNRPPAAVQIEEGVALVAGYARQQKDAAFSEIERLRASHHANITAIVSRGGTLTLPGGAQYTEAEARRLVDQHFDAERGKQEAHWAGLVERTRRDLEALAEPGGEAS
jgi:hypothetical protein